MLVYKLDDSINFICLNAIQRKHDESFSPSNLQCFIRKSQ